MSRRRTLYSSSGITSNLSYNSIEIWSLRKVIPSATYAVRIQRKSDNAETDVELPESGFISLASTVSAGGDLGTWAGSGDCFIKRVYGQQGFKDLLYTNAELSLIIGGVLNKLFPSSGIPAIKTNNVSGNGLEAIEINGGNDLTDVSIFSVYRNYGAVGVDAAANQAYSFGNINATPSLNNNKRVMALAGDNSIRFFGDKIDTNQVPADLNQKIRSSFKVGDTYSDYINGVENIAPTVRTGTSIVDDFYIGPYAQVNCRSYWTESIVFLNDQTANRQTIEAEINNEYQFF